MKVRIGSVVVAVGLAAFAAGCGSDKCKDESPPLSSTQPAQSCTVEVSSPVTVQIHACPRCDQGTPECLVHFDSATQITLEPSSQVCDPNSSCPVGGNCQVAPLNCTFTAPSTPGTIDLVVQSPSGGIPRTLEVVAVNSGATLGCDWL